MSKVRYTANAVVDDTHPLEHVEDLLVRNGFAVQAVREAHGLIVQRNDHSLDEFLGTLEGHLERFPSATIDDYGEAG